MTGSVETFHVSLESAEAYEAQFVPALFAEWAPHVVAAAAVAPGQDVVDVACGTGIVARAAADRLGGRGRVVGVDLNPSMLTVAERIRPDIEWKQGDACELPLGDGSFDVALCQSAIMFFPDRAKSVREMARVLRGGGTVGLQVWSTLDEQPAYGPFMRIAIEHAGPQAADLLGTYWSLGDIDLVGSLLEAAGFDDMEVTTRTGTAKFPSVDAVVKTEVESTPLIERITDETYESILSETREALARFVTTDGAADIPIAGHIVTARKR